MATRYISNNEPTKVESYDCILGISGATYYLLDIFDVGNKKISTCLEYLINLTTLTEIDGKFVPKFHVKSSEQITKEAQEIFKNGNINFGVSHGMMGPLLTLSKALNMGWKVNGLNVGVVSFIQSLRKDTKMKKKIYLVRDYCNVAGIKSEKPMLIEMSGKDFYNLVTSLEGDRRFFVHLTDDVGCC